MGPKIVLSGLSGTDRVQGRPCTRQPTQSGLGCSLRARYQVICLSQRIFHAVVACREFPEGMICTKVHNQCLWCLIFCLKQSPANRLKPPGGGDPPGVAITGCGKNLVLNRAAHEGRCQIVPTVLDSAQHKVRSCPGIQTAWAPGVRRIAVFTSGFFLARSFREHHGAPQRDLTLRRCHCAGGRVLHRNGGGHVHGTALRKKVKHFQVLKTPDDL
jgi:hypothetical protein